MTDGKIGTGHGDDQHVCSAKGSYKCWQQSAAALLNMTYSNFIGTRIPFKNEKLYRFCFSVVFSV